MPLDTSLPARVQEQFERGLRDVIAAVDRSGPDVRREVPLPDEESPLEIAPELARIDVWTPPEARDVGVDLQFDGLPDGDVAVIPTDLEEPAYDFPDDVDQREATYLAELAGGYATLSEAVVETLATYADAPEPDPERYFIDDRADLYCSACSGRQITFRTQVYCPEYVEQIYDADEWELARRLGLPGRLS